MQAIIEQRERVQIDQIGESAVRHVHYVIIAYYLLVRENKLGSIIKAYFI